MQHRVPFEKAWLLTTSASNGGGVMSYEQNLLKAGYKRYEVYAKGEFCTGLWQKVVQDQDEKAYFINFYKWEFPMGVGTFSPSDEPKVQFSVKVRMYQEDTEFELNLFVDGKTIEEVEKFYQDAYERLGCVPDRLNN